MVGVGGPLSWRYAVHFSFVVRLVIISCLRIPVEIELKGSRFNLILDMIRLAPQFQQLLIDPI